jgi:hypothetical protein
MLNPTHLPGIEGSRLRAGSCRWLLLSATGVEMRFRRPDIPDAVRVDVRTFRIWKWAARGKFLMSRRLSRPLSANL